MPRLLFVNQHYWPDVAATGQMMTDLAEHLVRRGFEVDVLCGRGKYTGGDLEAPVTEVRNGVGIRRIQTTSFGRGSVLGRLSDYAGVYLGVLRRLLAGPRYDLVIVLTTPPLLSYAAALAAKIRGQKYAIWSMDLHPDMEIGLEFLSPRSPVARLLEWLNRIGYRNADLVVSVGFRMSERIVEKGVAPERIRTIQVWSDGAEVSSVSPARNPVRRALGIGEEQVVVMYSGNAGLGHRFEEVLEAVRRLKDDPRFFFLFAGGGPRRKEIEAFLAEHEVANALYHDYFPREDLAEALSAGDVHLLTLREAMAGVNVPSKLYGIMAARRPVVMVGPTRSESAKTIRTHRFGFVHDPATPSVVDDLVASLEDLAADPARREALGRRGREAFEAHYDQPILCDVWTSALAETLDVDLQPTLAEAVEG